MVKKKRTNVEQRNILKKRFILSYALLVPFCKFFYYYYYSFKEMENQKKEKAHIAFNLLPPTIN